MSPFRGSDETLDREIETLEGIAKRRIRRYAADLRSVDKDLRDLRKERTRRRAATIISEPASTESYEPSSAGD
ncbi:MAG: hypothetical protein ACREBT_06480 [Thermoplasmata archaeon]